MNGQFFPTLGSLRERPIGAGKVFFVAAGGSDNDNGISPDTPFASITYALSQCVDNRNDYIIVLDNVSANEAAFPISVNKTRVHIIGMSNDAYPYVRLLPTSVNPAFEIGSVQHYEIAGFELGGGDATVACIASIAGPGTAGRGWIHHCSFAWLLGVLTARDGIWIQNTFDWCMSVVEDCLFNFELAATNGLVRDGIRIEGNATRAIFRRNYFKSIHDGNIGIHCIQNGSDIGAILDNLFWNLSSVAAGQAITMEVGVGNALIKGNRAGEHAAAPGNIPYRDLSTGGAATALNTWIENYDSTVGAAHANVLPAVL